MAKEREYSFIQKIKFALEENFVVRNVVLAVSIFVIAAILVFWSLNLFTRHGERLTVPNFSDMTIEQAIEASKEFDLEFMVIDSLHITKKPKGVILEQYPKPGNFVKKGRRIFITTNSFTPKMIPIPYVAGFSLRQAKNKIVGSGFVIDKITYKEDLATFNVLKQTYANKEITAGKEVMAEMGSGISLVVGLNPSAPEVIIPSIVGLNAGEAKNRLWEAGFNVGDVVSDVDVTSENYENAKVYKQEPLAARKAMHGRTISFNISADNNKVNNAIDNTSKEILKYQQELLKEDSTTIDSEAMEFERIMREMDSEID